MPTFKLTLEYDGTDFEGWQRQPGGHRTVQASLEAALEQVVGAPVAVVGAGRTDAGVHAEGQVASAALETRLDPATLARALNANLPRDLVVLGVEVAPPGFHPRRDARAKHYVYRIWNDPERSPLRARRYHAVAAPLDLAALRAAAACLEGTHDFKSFQAAGSGIEKTVRTLSRVAAVGEAGGEIRIEVSGDGFLRHMVRNLVGTLLEVGLGKRDPAGIAGVLEACERSAAGPTAPARGLTLARVEY